jgi:hypothetical protein
MRNGLATVLTAVVGLPVFAQNSDTKPQFELASIRECRQPGPPPVKSSPGRAPKHRF